MFLSVYTINYDIITDFFPLGISLIAEAITS